MGMDRVNSSSGLGDVVASGGPPARTTGRMPDFFIIGAAKSGTTTLYRYLSLHPQICMSMIKEPCYFDSTHPYRDRGLEWYSSLFAAARDEQLCGEASVNYTFWPKVPNAPELIVKSAPRAKFIYLLREPIQRAYSHFIHLHERELFVGQPYRMSFEEFLNHAPVVLYASDYACQIRRYLDHFPKDSILPLLFEDLINDYRDTLSKVFQFLQVEDLSTSLTAQPIHENSQMAFQKDMERSRILSPLDRIPGLKILYRGIPKPLRDASFRAIESLYLSRNSIARSTAPPMLAETRIKLAERFAEASAMVAEFYNLDISSWNTVPVQGE